MTDEPKKTIPVNPALSVRQDDAPRETTVVEQGPPPADYATRPESGVPTPSGAGLSGEQVASMIGNTDTTQTNDANRALQEQEGIDPDAGQN